MCMCVSVAETIHALPISPCPCQFRACWPGFHCHHLAGSAPWGQDDLLGKGTQELHPEVADTNTSDYEQITWQVLVDRQLRWGQ